MLTFVLAEAELELMPRALQRHPEVVRRAKQRRREPAHLLLDQALDHKAMRDLSEEGDRRGRPDIAHVFLLLLQDSLLNQRQQARVLLHTRDDALVRVRPDTRIMRHGPKFAQLVEDLLRQGEVPLGQPLLTAEKGWPLRRVLDEEARGTRVLLDESGTLARTSAFETLARGGDATFVLGGFPRGRFRQAEPAWFDHVLRVADAPVSSWTALVPVLAGCEDALLTSGT